MTAEAKPKARRGPQKRRDSHMGPYPDPQPATAVLDREKWLGVKRGQKGIMREAVLAAFHNLGAAHGMTEWAIENRTEFYKIAAKLIPQEIEGDLTGVIKVVHRVE